MKSSKTLRSNLNNIYLICELIKEFDNKKLPLKLQVLQRLQDCINSNKNKQDCFVSIYEDLKILWESANIKIKSKKSIINQLENLWTDYKNLQKHKWRRNNKIKEDDFLKSLNEN